MDLIEHFRNAREIVNVPAGRVLFNEGEPGSVLYVLLDGTAAVFVHRRMVELATPGAVLGEMALINNAPRSATVLTRTACRLVAIDRQRFDLLVRETPGFARHVMGIMAERLRRMNASIDEALRTPLTLR